MTPKQYAWHLVVFAAISVIGNVYLGYYLLFGLASDGLDVADESGRVVVTDVEAHAAAEQSNCQRTANRDRGGLAGATDEFRARPADVDSS